VVASELGRNPRAATFEVPVGGYDLYGVNVSTSLRFQLTPYDEAAPTETG
jgi:hypothetical protein